MREILMVFYWNDDFWKIFYKKLMKEKSLFYYNMKNFFKNTKLYENTMKNNDINLKNGYRENY